MINGANGYDEPESDTNVETLKTSIAGFELTGMLCRIF